MSSDSAPKLQMAVSSQIHGTFSKVFHLSLPVSSSKNEIIFLSTCHCILICFPKFLI